jgi:hypothetical protein
MQTAEKIPEPWLSFLNPLDAAAPGRVRFDCLGGFVITQVYGFSRATGDLDVLEIAPKDIGLRLLELGMRGGSLHKKYKIYLDRVGVTHVPEEYEGRLTEIFPGTFKQLRLFALDPYDLALSKLERNIQRDRDDVRHLARTVPFDLDVLRKRYTNELRWQLGNPEREDLTLQLWIDAIEEERSQRQSGKQDFRGRAKPGLWILPKQKTGSDISLFFIVTQRWLPFRWAARSQFGLQQHLKSSSENNLS